MFQSLAAGIQENIEEISARALPGTGLASAVEAVRITATKRLT